MGGRGGLSGLAGGGATSAIEAYTAQGGQYASKYPFTAEKRALLTKLADESTYTTQEDIWRKVDITEGDRDKLFNSLYNNGSTDIDLTGLNSFTRDQRRVAGYGGTQMQSVRYVIPKGTTVHGLDISKASIYPEEMEVLLGKNRFTASYDELQWTSSGNMIITLRPKK